MPGTPRNNSKKVHPILGDVLDLDALISKRVLAPKPVRLAGKTYMVRTNLTGTEVTDYYKLAGDKRDTEALALLVGDDAAELNALLETLPREHMNIVVRELMVASGIVIGVSATEEEAGESKAS
jgi:hypothetical protein